jgi:hypothetical protein
VWAGLIAWTIKKNWATFKTKKSAVEMVARVFVFTLFGVFALAYVLYSLSLFYLPRPTLLRFVPFPFPTPDLTLLTSLILPI